MQGMHDTVAFRGGQDGAQLREGQGSMQPGKSPKRRHASAESRPHWVSLAGQAGLVGSAHEVAAAVVLCLAAAKLVV